MRSTLRVLSAGLLFPLALAAQQLATPAAAMPKVGDVAPDFSLAAGTMSGVSAKPVKLSDLRGKTVVIAFYPRQRSSGCTIQMMHYRDFYSDIFGKGDDVMLLAVSTDSVKDIASWAVEEKFPFTFLSDPDGATGKAYATMYGTRNMERRILFVVAPNGKVSHVMSPFNEVDPVSYEQLTKAINDAKGMKE